MLYRRSGFVYWSTGTRHSLSRASPQFEESGATASMRSRWSATALSLA